MIPITRAEWDIKFTDLLKQYNSRERDGEPYWKHAKDKHYNHVTAALEFLITSCRTLPTPANFANALKRSGKKFYKMEKSSQPGPGGIMLDRVENDRCIQCNRPRSESPSEDAYRCAHCYEERQQGFIESRKYYEAKGWCITEAEYRRKLREVDSIAKILKKVCKTYGLEVKEEVEEENRLTF